MDRPASPPALLRRATATDAAALSRLATAAFTDTYREIDAAEHIGDYVARHLDEASIAALIADPLRTTLLSELDGALVGYAVVARSTPPDGVTGPAPIELARLYLDHRCIGQGLGAQLMQAVVAEARAQGGRTLWLGVYDRNLRAIRFYERFGFRRAGTKGFAFGGEVYEDPVYALAIG